MKNFPVKVDGKEYWISRSIAVCVFVFKIKGNKLYALIERRGKGAADEQGKLCTCSGYLDFNECDREAVYCKRRTFTIYVYQFRPQSG